jgi:hypothetical protein
MQRNFRPDSRVKTALQQEIGASLRKRKDPARLIRALITKPSRPNSDKHFLLQAAKAALLGVIFLPQV